MRIALTGTPGTGKTTVAGLLPCRKIDINALVKAGLNLGRDGVRGCLDADMQGLAERLDQMEAEQAWPFDAPVILEGHFSHHFAERAIVLRLAPSQLALRLQSRGYSEAKIRENLEAEALDVILVEAVEMCGQVDEIDTTGKSPQEVASIAEQLIKGVLSLPPGQVDWLDDFFG
jgi:adenylate kinase